MKILIIQQKMIGDVLTSTILFDALREKYPSAELHYLINSSTVAVVENNPFINKLVILDPKTSKTIWSSFNFFNNMKKEKFDLVIDLYSKPFSAGVSYFSRAKKRIGKKKWYLAWAYTDTITLSSHSPETTIPMAYINRLDFLRPLLDDIDYNIVPKIFVTETEKGLMRKRLLEQGLTDNLIVVNCLGSSESKTYPLEYMATLLDNLTGHFPEKKILLNYPPHQKKEVENLLTLCSKNTRQNISKFNASSLRDFIVLTTFCEAVIGNEGGAINIAKALNVKTWAIFSPWIRPESWVRKNDPNHIAVHLKYIRPELYTGHEKHTKKKYRELYQLLKPTIVFESLKVFLENR